MSFLDALNSYKKAASSEPGAVSTKKESFAAPYRHPLLETLVKIKADATQLGETAAVDGASKEDSSCCGLTLLFIIVDSFPHEAIWRSWLEHGSEASRGKVRVLIHAKFPHKLTSPWVKRHLCKTFHLNPSWGSLELTEVMVRLLEESMQREVDLPIVGSLPSYLEAPADDKETKGEAEKEGGVDHKEGEGDSKAMAIPGDTTSEEKPGEATNESVSSGHFAFASESCIPIRSLDETFQEIEQSCSDSKHPSSWLNYTDKATNGYAQQLQFDKLQGVIPSDCLFKSDQWILLNRRHAQEVLSLPSLIETSGAAREGQAAEKEKDGGGEGGGKYRNKMLQLFKKTRASDEMYFPCSLGVLNALSASPDAEGGSVRRRQVTYCDWSQGGKNPHEYRAAPALFSGEGVAVGSAKAQGCLFMRKVMFPKEGGAGAVAADTVAFYDAWRGHVLGEESGKGEKTNHLSRIAEEHRWFKVEHEKERKAKDLKRKRQDQERDKDRDRDRRDGGDRFYGARSRGEWGGYRGPGAGERDRNNYGGGRDNYGGGRDHYRQGGGGHYQGGGNHGGRGGHGGENSKRYRY